MESKELGCVYFFKHVGLKPVKIGYSSSNNPNKRFEQFKTYAPFGAEIIGFIQTEKAKQLEKKLHKKFAAERLDGEWFNISEAEAKNLIEYYTNKEQVKARNNFHILYSKFLESGKLKKKHFGTSKNGVDEIAERIKQAYFIDPNLNKSRLAKSLRISRQYVYKVIYKIKSEQL
jgi:hypothetical protein